MILERKFKSPDGVFRITGRDLAAKDLAFKFGYDLPGLWSYVGEADVNEFEMINMSPSRQAVFDAVIDTPISPKEIWEQLGGVKSPHSYAVVRQQLSNLLDDGLVVQPAMGLYVLPQTEQNEQSETNTDDLSTEVSTDSVEQLEDNPEFEKALNEVMKHKVNEPVMTEDEKSVEVEIESEADTEQEEVEEEQPVVSYLFADSDNKF